MEIQELIKNKIDLGGKNYAAIIGGNPSEGARSPQLWDAAFSLHGIDSVMLPMDLDADMLPDLMKAINNDHHFLGGAISVPHKELVADWLISKGSEYISKEAAAIGAVNSLYRNNGNIFGTNTDGEAALKSLKNKCNDLESKNVLLIGPGGAGKAVAAYISQYLEEGRLKISARAPEKVQELASKIDADIISWPPSESEISNADVVVNCSTLGSKSTSEISGQSLTLENFTPLSTDPKDDIERIQLLKSETVVFDIIYDPSPTKLLKLSSDRGLTTIDGSDMNLEQAVLAFNYALKNNKGLDQIRKAMSETL